MEGPHIDTTEQTVNHWESYTTSDAEHTLNNWDILINEGLKKKDDAALEGMLDESEIPDEAENSQMDEERREEIIKRAFKYRGVKAIEAFMDEMKSEGNEQAEEQEEMEEDKTSEERQAEAFIRQLRILDDPQLEKLEKILDRIDEAIAYQRENMVIDHKQINTKDALEKELQSGSAIPELDIRFDKDGKPWISHSQRSGARFFFSKPIHEMTSEEVAKKGERLSLEDGLKMISEYYKDNPNHRVVLELKELGPSAETHKPYLEGIQKMLKETGLTDAAIFATLSADVLIDTHEVFPDNPKILNGGIAPVISYNLAERSAQDVSGKEIKVKLPNVELYLSDSSEVTRRADGYGKQTGYLWMRLPKAVVKTLREMRGKGSVGAASLTLVNKVAGLIEKPFPKAAKKMREHYADQLHGMGLDIQVAIPKHNPAKGYAKAKEQMGGKTIIYANDDHIADWIMDLIDEERNKAA